MRLHPHFSTHCALLCVVLSPFFGHVAGVRATAISQKQAEGQETMGRQGATDDDVPSVRFRFEPPLGDGNGRIEDIHVPMAPPSEGDERVRDLDGFYYGELDFAEELAGLPNDNDGDSRSTAPAKDGDGPEGPFSFDLAYFDGGPRWLALLPVSRCFFYAEKGSASEPCRDARCKRTPLLLADNYAAVDGARGVVCYADYGTRGGHMLKGKDFQARLDAREAFFTARYGEATMEMDIIDRGLARERLKEKGSE